MGCPQRLDCGRRLPFTAWQGLLLLLLETASATPAPSASRLGLGPANGARGRPLAHGEDGGECEFVSPPMGWNSYDSTPGGAGITEAEALTAARFVAEYLRPVGYEYVVLDAGWHGPLDGSAMALDIFGRLAPNSTLHPSSAGGAGFKPLADRVHGLGLKFGFWIMGGIPRKAVQRKLPIQGTNFTADEAADLTDRRACSWQPGFVYGTRLDSSGNLHPAAVAYYDSLARLYNSWGVDFIKIDCVFGGDYGRGRQDAEQFATSMNGVGRPYTLSLSPGSSSSMALVGQEFASRYRPGQRTMGRMTGDFWDDWPSLLEHFGIAAELASYMGPEFFPDLDMLPLGWLGHEGVSHYSRFNAAEARTLMTLWAVARAPLVWGGSASAARANRTTLALISNPEVLNVSRNSCNNHQLQNQSGVLIWTAQGRQPRSRYVAFLNAGDEAAEAEVPLSSVGLSPLSPSRLPRGAAAQEVAAALAAAAPAFVARDLWAGTEAPVTGGKLTARLDPHGSSLLLLRPAEALGEE